MTPLTTKAAEIRAGLVKPLEWDLSGMDRGYPAKAESIFGTYSAWEIDDSYWKAPEAHCGRRASVGLQSALDAAQSDYESRILSALDLSGIEQQAAELAEAREESARRLACMDRRADRVIELTDELTKAKAGYGGLLSTWAESRDRHLAAESERDELLREKERLGAGWRPIETAPKDGTTFLAYQAEEGVDFFHWQDFGADSTAPKGWRDSFIHVYPEGSENGPKHWMPLPVPPAAEQEAV